VADPVDDATKLGPVVADLFSRGQDFD